MADWSSKVLQDEPSAEKSGGTKWSDAVLNDEPVASDSNVPEGMFLNPYTGQMTNREMLQGSAETSRGRAAGYGYLQGGSLNSIDEAEGLIRGDFDQELLRAKIAANQEAYPGTFLTGQVAGGASTLGPVFGGARTLVGQVGRAAVGGAAAGSVDAFNSGEGGLGNRLVRVPVGGAAGAAGGVIGVPLGNAISWVGRTYGPKIARVLSDDRYMNEFGLTEAGRNAVESLGLKPDELTEGLAREIQRNLDDGIKPTEAGGVAVMEQFGIPAFKANRTGTVTDFAELEAARRTGGANERRVREALDSQTNAMRDAGDRIATDIGGGVRGDQGDAAVAVSERLRTLAQQEKTTAQKLYDRAGQGDVVVSPGQTSSIADRISTRLDSEDIDVDLRAYPEAQAVLNTIVKRGAKEADAPVSLQRVDELRKDLNRSLNRTKEGTQDYRALSIIKQEYDGWFDDVVENRLFSGDPDAIEDLFGARRLWSEYSQKFRGRDAGSKFIQQMMDADASPDDVVKWLFSAGKLGTGKFNSTLASSLKETLGAGSDEWNLVRQAAIRQLMERPEGMTQWGPQKIGSNISEFFRSPSSRELAKELFTQQERSQLLQFRQALNRMTPPEGAVNYSNTGYENARTAQKLFKALMGAVGMQAGGPAGAAGAVGAASAGSTAKNWLKTRSALSQPPRRRPPTSGQVQGGVAVGGATTAQPQDRPR